MGNMDRNFSESPLYVDHDTETTYLALCTYIYRKVGVMLLFSKWISEIVTLKFTSWNLITDFLGRFRLYIQLSEFREKLFKFWLSSLQY